MLIQQSRPSTFSVIVQTANPIFILLAVGIPVIALIYVLNFGSRTSLDFVHIMTAVIWTGTDLFYGFVLGPVLGGMDPKDRVVVFKRLVPKMTFLMPVIATVAIISGIKLTQLLGFSLTSPLVVAALVIVSLMCLIGFAILLPNEIRVFQQLISKVPSIEKISMHIGG